MVDPPPSEDPSASAREREHLEEAHHELCTALTVLRSRVELVRVELRDGSGDSAQIRVHQHVRELDLAVDRLGRLALRLRSWHDRAEVAPAKQP